MKLSTAQKATVKSWIDTNMPASTEDEIALALNATASPNYFTWLKAADKAVVDAQIVKSVFTPSDTIPTSPSTDMTFQNRALACQLKQTNAQWLALGTGSIDARLASVRTNFQDCLTQIPSGTNGANQNAGWGSAASVGAVRAVMMRTVTVFEKMFVVQAAAGPGNNGADARGLATNPDICGTDADGNEVAGKITAQQVSDIRGGL